MPHESPQHSVPATQWWIAVGDTAKGPFTSEYVRERLQARKLSGQALLCPVGEEQWKQAVEWPQFQEDRLPQTTSPPEPELAATVDEPLLTNPELPPVANWICVYCILVSPFSWLFSLLSWAAALGFIFHVQSRFFAAELILNLLTKAITLAFTVALVIAGLQLRALRRSGVTLFKMAFYVALGAVLLITLFQFILLRVADETDFAATTDEPLIGRLALLLATAELLFLIFALVWLHRFGGTLPLSEGRELPNDGQSLGSSNNNGTQQCSGTAPANAPPQLPVPSVPHVPMVRFDRQVGGGREQVERMRVFLDGWTTPTIATLVFAVVVVFKLESGSSSMISGWIVKLLTLVFFISLIWIVFLLYCCWRHWRATRIVTPSTPIEDIRQDAQG